MVDQPGAGASARREYERRKARDAATVDARKAQVRDRFGGGRFGSAVAALSVDSSERSSTRVWAQGAVGEEIVAQHLDRLVSPSVLVLHDRKIPGSRANIDHIVVTRAGVTVIDSKRYLRKRPERYAGNGLKVGGRRRDSLLEGMNTQLQRVRAELPDSVDLAGVLCFVDADWPIIGGSFSVKGIRVLWPKLLVKELSRQPDKGVDVPGLALHLEGVFGPA